MYDMSNNEKKTFPNYKTLGGYLKSESIPINHAFPIAFNKLSREGKMRWVKLPNFDADKFLKITGVDVRLDPDIEL
jgi:hypothetical protein